ncbi:MAG: chromosomal replication initiator protein DnaA [Thermodesulfobacteriota bacterium]
MKDLWSQCMNVLSTRVNEHTLVTWLKPICCEDISDGRILLSVPNNFFISWIKDNYLNLIHQSIVELAGTHLKIEFESRNDFGHHQEGQPQVSGSVPGSGSVRLSLTEEFALKKNLNPRYTFNSFVVGSCNQFAHAAARAVSEHLGGNYNPLFLYAGTGLGKTHLMSAIGYSVLAADKSKKISFATSEEFMNEMINAIRFDRMGDFREKYRNVDLLLIDDIQFIGGKERTQEEFFHTFNSICENGKQIVITSDRPPNEIPDIEHRLRSRFGWGLIANMEIPDLETRVAILKKKAFDDSVYLPDDVAYFLAEHARSNIRELVGCLIRVIAMSTLQGLPITKELAQTAIADIYPRRDRKISMDEIIGQVAKTFNVKVSDVKSKKKHKLYALPRQVAMYLGRELTELSYPEIGGAFGGKDHSTVIYATRKIEKLLEKDNSLKNLVDGLKMDLRR